MELIKELTQYEVECDCDDGCCKACRLMFLARVELAKQAERVRALEALLNETDCECEYETDDLEPDDDTEYCSFVCPKCRAKALEGK